MDQVFARQLSKLPVITHAQEITMTGQPAQLAKDGHREEWEKLRNKFVALNLRLVAKALGKFRRSTIDPMELFNEGVLGMMRACDMFEPERGNRFGTYAWLWITHYMRRYSEEKSRMIKSAYPSVATKYSHSLRHDASKYTRCG